MGEHAVHGHHRRSVATTFVELGLENLDWPSKNNVDSRLKSFAYFPS